MIVPLFFFFFIVALFVDPYSDQKACGIDLMCLMPLPYPTDIHFPQASRQRDTAFISKQKH